MDKNFQWKFVVIVSATKILQSAKQNIRRRPTKFWVRNIFNCNLQQNLRFLQHSSRHYLPRLSLYILLLPCRKTLEILLLSQKVVLPPLCWEKFFILISLDLKCYLEYKLFGIDFLVYFTSLFPSIFTFPYSFLKTLVCIIFLLKLINCVIHFWVSFDFKIIYNPGHNILALFNNLAYVWLTTSKTILDIYQKRLGTLHGNAEWLKTYNLRKFGNIRKMSNAEVDTPQRPAPPQKPNADNSCPKTRKTRYYIPEAPPNSTASPYPAPNTPSGTVDNTILKSKIFDFKIMLSHKLILKSSWDDFQFDVSTSD